MLTNIMNNLKNINEIFRKSNYKNKDLYMEYISDAMNLIVNQNVELQDLKKLRNKYTEVIETAKLEQSTNDIGQLEKKLEIQSYKIKKITNIIVVISGYFLALLFASSIAMALIKLLIWIINI